MSNQSLKKIQKSFFFEKLLIFATMFAKKPVCNTTTSAHALLSNQNKKMAPQAVVTFGEN
jgi:hypothetical protein